MVTGHHFRIKFPNIKGEEALVYDIKPEEQMD
jgi:hypothetical protein